MGVLFVGGVASADEYVVKQGDTLSEIAINNNTTIEDILNNNPQILNENLIFIGDKIEIGTPIQTQSQPVYQPQTTEPEQVVQQAPVVQENVQEVQTQVVEQVQQTTIEQPVVENNSAKEWIAERESGGSYTAQNPSGAYGKYQLMPFNLKYGTTPEAQDRAADEYVISRYGSWENAKAFWIANSWY